VLASPHLTRTLDFYDERRGEACLNPSVRSRLSNLLKSKRRRTGDRKQNKAEREWRARRAEKLEFRVIESVGSTPKALAEIQFRHNPKRHWRG